MLNLDNVALRRGPLTWGETILVNALPDWTCLFLLIRGRLEQPELAPELLKLTLVEVGILQAKFIEAVEVTPGTAPVPGVSTGKPPVFNADHILGQVFGVGPGEILP